MREEEEPNWFARWEEQLPSPEELMPLSQTLITPDLALAFDIPTIRSNPNPNPSLHHHHPAPSLHPPPPVPSSQPPPDFDSPDHLTTASSGGGACGGGGGGGGVEEPARTLKRPRLVWTPQLHKRFVDAVAHLGIKNAVPKTIMQLMGVEGLTRENVASHLQKYRLYLKRMQQSSSSSSSSAALAGGHISAADHQLFASGPLPHHFLRPRGAAGPEPPFVPLVAVNPLHHHHHHHQIGQQYYYQRQMGHFGSAASGGVGVGGGFDYRFLSPPPIGMQHVEMGMGMGMGFPPAASSYGEQLESGERGGGRRELTLFPTGDD